MKTSPESKSTTPGSSTRSLEQERPEATWDANWILIRRLWPEWSPTDEQVREVWFQAFDKKHGEIGENRVNHDALREAILAVARSKRFKDPTFIDISDAYRHERGRIIAEIERTRNASKIDDERIRVEAEADRLRDIIEAWTADRLLAARQFVEDKIPTFSGKSTDPASWSRTYVGFLIAADEEIQKEAQT